LLHFFSGKSRPRDEYIRTILSPNSWGGATELTMLAARYRTEIASIDVKTGRINTFSPSDDSSASESCALLIYSGIHYDAAVLAPEPDAPQDFCASVVLAIGAEGEHVLDALRALATRLRDKRAYTNTATFNLRCEVSWVFFFSRVVADEWTLVGMSSALEKTALCVPSYASSEAFLWL
jgi:ubiquitin thioesterase OTU1